MPTSKPRILVTLEPEDYALVRRVASVSGVSMASLLREYVEMSRPMLQHMAQLADSLESAQAERKEVHEEAVQRVLDKGQLLADAASGQLPLFYDMLESLAQAISGGGIDLGDFTRSLAEEGMSTDPQLCNTGVSFSSQVQNTPLLPHKTERKNCFNNEDPDPEPPPVGGSDG